MITSTNDRIDQATADAKDDGYILGKVVDNKDPLGIGRVKVEIPNLFDPGESSVPWIGAHRQSPFGYGPNFGVYGSPQIGTTVRVKFQNGNAHYGLSEADEYNKSIANAKFKDPNTWGFRDPSGSELFVNMTTKAWEFTHASGVSIKYNAEGDNKVTIVRNQETTIGGSNTETVEGDQTQNISGDLSIVVEGNASIQTTNGNLSLTSQGPTSIAASDVNVAASGNVNITGGVVNLN